MKLTISRMITFSLLLFGPGSVCVGQQQSKLSDTADQEAIRKTREVKFDAQVPSAPVKLPLLRLSPQKPPTKLLNLLLEATKRDKKLGPLSADPFLVENRIRPPEQILGIVEDEHVRAWVDLRSGDAAIYPTLNRLTPIQKSSVVEWQTRVSEVFASREFLGSDDTRFVVDNPQTLSGTTLVREKSGEAHAEKPSASYLAYFLARRFVEDYPVDGPGSRALLAVGSGGVIEGLTRSWKLGKIYQTIESSRNASQVREEIIRELLPALEASDVTVLSVEIAYYDSNREFMQPVYRFTAQIHHRAQEANVKVADDFVIGYIPYGKAVEPLPSLTAGAGPKPTLASKQPSPPTKALKPAPNDPIVGRYVVRDDDSGWVNDANSFWNSISASWTGVLFTNSQYYWAEPRLFTNQKDSFINAMNLGLIEVHGDWWLYSTLRNCCDLVNINGDIPNPGYGPSANGRLADWVIHSCEVVPAPDDTAQWPDPWWTIFGGLRNVVGYRTIMYISDGAGGPYGSSLGNVAPVVSSWLSDIISLNAYSGHPTTAAHGGVVRPMGRPSTISMCGHDSDSVFSTSTLGRAGCVTVWWFPD